MMKGAVDVKHKESCELLMEMLETVRIREAGKVYDLYPHQVSGGMGQQPAQQISVR